MRNSMLALLIVPAAAGMNVLGRSDHVAVAAPAARGEAFAALVARALVGEFRADAHSSPNGTRPTVRRTACEVRAPGLGPHVVYVEDRFEGRSNPFAQRLFSIHPSSDGAVLREFNLIDPEAAAGLCQQGVTPTVYRANTVHRAGCELSLRRNGAAVEGETPPSRCESRINDARFVIRSLRLADDAVVFSERGIDAGGRAVWGGASAAMRFTRR